MARPQQVTDDQIRQALLMGSGSASELCDRLSRLSGNTLSRPALSRRLAAMADVAVLGAGPAAQTHLLKSVSGISQWPVWQVLPSGQVNALGRILRTQQGWAWDFNQWRGFNESLPWFIQDEIPQGFLGRHLAERFDVSPDKSGVWPDDEVLRHISGLNTMGDLLIGMDQYNAHITGIAPPVLSLSDLTSHTHDVLKAAIGGSSAGGEQPKIVCSVDGFGDCIVKFSDDVTHNQNARRWGDLLVAEKLASDVLRQHGIQAAETEVAQQGGQMFLLSRRFDRLNNGGRYGVVSLRTLVAEFVGGDMSGPWGAPVAALHQQGVINDCRHDVELSWAFGHLIANSDMHFGNLSFLRAHALDSWRNGKPHADCRFGLAPIYDMLPMAFAPTRSGTMRYEPLTIQLNGAIGQALWQQAFHMADSFWQQVALHAFVSTGFKEIADQQRQWLIRELPAQIGRCA